MLIYSLLIKQGNPLFSTPIKFSAGTTTSSRAIQVLSAAFHPVFFIWRRVTPGRSRGMTSTEMPPTPGPPVRTAVVMWVLLMAPDIHFWRRLPKVSHVSGVISYPGTWDIRTLCPLTTYAFPSTVFSAVVLRLARSEPPGQTCQPTTRRHDVWRAADSPWSYLWARSRRDKMKSSP